MRNSSRFGLFLALAIAILSSTAFWDGEGSSVNAFFFLHGSEDVAQEEPAAAGAIDLDVSAADPEALAARRAAFIADVAHHLERSAHGPAGKDGASRPASES